MTANGSADPTTLQVRGLTKTFGAVYALLEVSLSVPAGRTLALLGPSGCGKTTLLRTVAGLEAPDAGQVHLGTDVLTDGHRVVPPERRRMGMVFQDWALFPHLTVAGNVGYGLARRDRARVDEVLALVGLARLGHRLPSTLSGGQQQRVALARALAPRPRVLLLDEPFSNLDAAMRIRVRSEVQALVHHLGVTSVFVTHDQEEAFVIGDEVAVMRDGVVVQCGVPDDVYTHPATPWVATFVGAANLVPGQADGHHVLTLLGPLPVVGSRRGPVEVLLRPESLRLAPGGPAVVERVEFRGAETHYRVRLDGLSLHVREPGPPPHRPGDAVSVGHTGHPVHCFEPPAASAACAAASAPLGAA